MHLLDPQPDDGSDPAANYRAIHHELAEYSTALAEKTELIVLNKADVLGDEADAQVAALSKELGQPVLLISAVTGHGVRALLETCWAALRGPVSDG